MQRFFSNRSAARQRVALAIALMLPVLAPRFAGQETSSPPEAKVTIPSQPFLFLSGSPLSTRTLVARPPTIKGLLNWTIETTRHRGWMYSAVPSPDGKQLASGGLDGTIRIWDTTDGRLLKALVASNSYLFHVAWSSDGTYLAAAGAFDSVATIWHVESGRLLCTLKHPGHATRVAWSPDDRRLLVAGGSSGHLRLWDTEKATQVGELDMGQVVQVIAWSRNGSKIAVGVQGQPTHLVDATDMRVTTSMGEVSTSPKSLAWSPDSTRLAVAAAKGTTIWDAENVKLATSLPPATAVAWSPDGTSLAAVPPTGTIHLWDPITGDALDKLTIGASEIAWAPDSGSLFASTSDTVTIWDLAAKQSRLSMKIAGSTPQIQWIAANKLIATGVGSTSITIYQPDCKPIHEFRGHSAAVTCVALSPDGKTLATGSADTTIKLWDFTSGKVLHTLNSHAGPVTALAWSANSKLFASGCTDKIVRIWDSDGRLLHKLPGHTDKVDQLAWSARSLASGGPDSQAILWNPTTGQKLREFKVGGGVDSLAWTHDGKYLAAGDGDSKITIWKTDNGTVMSRLERPGSPRSISALAWARNAPLLAAGRANHFVQPWDIRTGKPTRDIPAIAPVQSVAWSEDEKVLIAAGTDRCLRFWDAVNGRLRGTIIGGADGISIVSADGHYRTLADTQSDLVYIAQNDQGQSTYSLSDFAKTFKWRNVPTFRLW